MISALAFTKLLSTTFVRLWEFISPPTTLYSLPILNHITLTVLTAKPTWQLVQQHLKMRRNYTSRKHDLRL